MYIEFSCTHPISLQLNPPRWFSIWILWDQFTYCNRQCSWHPQLIQHQVDLVMISTYSMKWTAKAFFVFLKNHQLGSAPPPIVHPLLAGLVMFCNSSVMLPNCFFFLSPNIALTLQFHPITLHLQPGLVKQSYIRITCWPQIHHLLSIDSTGTVDGTTHQVHHLDLTGQAGTLNCDVLLSAWTLNSHCSTIHHKQALHLQGWICITD
jgi:hypothetical protein